MLVKIKGLSSLLWWIKVQKNSSVCLCNIWEAAAQKLHQLPRLQTHIHKLKASFAFPVYIYLTQSPPGQTDPLHLISSKPFSSSSSTLLSLRCVQSNIVLLTQAFRKKFVIPDFQSFCGHMDDLFENAKNLSGGQVSVLTLLLSSSQGSKEGRREGRKGGREERKEGR